MIRTTGQTSRLGDATSSIVDTSAQVLGASLSTTAAAAGAGLITLSATAAAAIPVAGALVAVGVLAYSLFHNSLGLQQDADTTKVVNNAADLMNKNVIAWQSSNKSFTNQAAGLQTFDQLWKAIVNFCSNGNEGTPGQRCVSERQRGGKYDFFAYYRDPIANDPAAGNVDRAASANLVSAANTATQTGLTSIASATGLQPGLIVPAAAALAIAFYFASK